jgi:hypothetical protein
MVICDEGTELPVGDRDDGDLNIGPPELPHTPTDTTRSPCTGATPVIHTVQCKKTTIRLYLTDRNGETIPLIEDIPGSSSVPADDFTAEFVAKDTVVSRVIRISKTGTVVDYEKSIVEVDLTPDDLARPGLYLAQLSIKNEDGDTIACTQYYLEVMPSIEVTTMTGGPLSFAEVRLMLRDECAQRNLLLDAIEFDDSQIALCMRLPIDKFNETNQPQTKYNARNFPFRYHWLKATIGHLLGIAARGYARDHLPYSAGGVSIDDKNKAGIYNELSNQLLSEYHNFVVSKKIQINIEGGYGTLHSDYSYYGIY